MTELEAMTRADQIVQHHLDNPLELRSFVAHCLLADARIADRDGWKQMANEYSACLQPLVMDVLYKHCEPVSHGWPGKKHVDGIREAVDFLLSKIAALEAHNKLLLEECRAWRDPKHAVVCEWGHTCPDGRTAIPYGCSACESRDKLRAARAATDAAGALGEK